MRALHLAGVCALVASLAGAPQAEAGDQSSGLRFADPEQYLAIPLLVASPVDQLPNQVDLRPDLPPPDPVGQGTRQGSCVGWALAALKTYQERRESPASAPAFFSPAFLYNQLHKFDGPCGTSEFREGLNLLVTTGAVPETRFPYDIGSCVAKPSEALKRSAGAYRVATYRRVNPGDPTEIKRHLYAGFPVLIGFAAGPQFRSLATGSTYTGEMSADVEGHAMVVAGYDEQRQAFLLWNSWGTQWGEKGYGWIAYPAFAQHVREAYVVVDISGSRQGVDIEIIQRAWQQERVAATPVKTRNHHCERNCEGEPTRTNYTSQLVAGDDTLLRHARIECIGGPCHGWNQVYPLRYEVDSRRVVASWDVWGHPTTWLLSADELTPRETLRVARAVGWGEQFEVEQSAQAPPPRVEGRGPNGEMFGFTTGEPTKTVLVRYLGARTESARVVHTYAVGPSVVR